MLHLKFFRDWLIGVAARPREDIKIFEFDLKFEVNQLGLELANQEVDRF